jgi:hypothetical protein
MGTKMEEFQVPSSTRLGSFSPVLFANGFHNIQTFICRFSNLMCSGSHPTNADFKHKNIKHFSDLSEEISTTTL